MKQFIPFIIVAICIGMYFMYIRPTLAEISTLSEKKAEYLNVLEKTKEIKEQRDVATSAYNNISEDDLNKLNKIIPSKFDSVAFANDVNSIGSRYGIVIKDLKVNMPTTESRDVANAQASDQTHKTIIITLDVTGQYEQFVRFLKDLESSLRLMDVGVLSVKSANGPKNEVVLTYSLEIYTYSLQ